MPTGGNNGLYGFIGEEMKRKTVLFFVAACCVLWCRHGFAAKPEADAGKAQNIRADLVWAQSDGLRDEIFLSAFKNGRWGKTVPITDDNADNLHPAVDQTSNGTRWIAWTAVEDGVYSILARSWRNEQLGEVMVVSQGLTMNIYPTVIVDRSDTVWIVWSGNAGANDDIFYSRLVDSKWQQPRPVHQANQVPDIRPEVSLNSDGMPVVRWQRFVDGSYHEIESHWLDRAWSVPLTAQKDEDKLQQKQVDAAWQMTLLKSRPAAMDNVQGEFVKIY